MNNYNDRKVDKISVDKSKKYLWKYIQDQKGLHAQTTKAHKKAPKESWFFKIFSVKKVAWTSAIAVLTIIAVLFGPNLQNLLQGDLITPTQIANASFTMEADSQDAAGIESTSTFTIKSDVDLDASVIEENLAATPEVDLNVTKIAEGEYKIEPAQNLNNNTVYNFTIKALNEGQIEEFSWAYQVKDEFKIYGTLPGNETANVPINSGIEINFSHENFDTQVAKEYFTISPATEGKFEKHGRILVFVPTNGLIAGTIYEVSIKAGLPLKDSNKKLANDEIFKFETGSHIATSKNHFRFTQDQYEIGTNQTVALTVGWYSTSEEEISNKVNLKVYKFKTQDDYLNILKEKNALPSWTSYAQKNYNYDTSQLNYQGEYEGQIEELNHKQFVHAPTANLDPGYYLFEGNNDGRISKTLVQITDLSSYVTASKDGSLVWVNDVSTGEPVKDAKVEIINHDKTVKTNGEGIATFNIPLEEVNNLLLKITAPNNKSQISNLALNEWSKDGNKIADYWYSFMTDRPVYLPDDTIKFWGFLKPKNNAPINELRVELSEGFWGPRTFAAQVEVQPTNNHTFQGHIDIDDMPNGYFTMNLYNGDDLLTSEFISIQTYNKPTYELAVASDKRAIFYDETAHITIDSRFFEGTPVPNLLLHYNVDKQVTTDSNGHYEFDYQPSPSDPCTYKDNYCSTTRSDGLRFSPMPKEDSMIGQSINMRVFGSRLNISAKTETEGNEATVHINTNWVDLSKLNEDENAGYSDFVGETAQNREIQGRIVEKWTDKIEKGEKYDFINKRTVKEYEYVQRSRDVGEFAVETDQNGEATHKFEMIKGRYYQIYLSSNDNDGKSSYRRTYAYYGGDDDYTFMQIKVLNYKDEYGPYKYDLGETVETGIAANQSILPADTEGKFLFIQYNNGLSEYAVKDKPLYNFTMGKNQIPGAQIEGVWFDGNSYRFAWGTTIGFDPATKAINIEVESVKEAYQPGDKATIKIKTTDQDGRGVKSEVLLNLVDEAYYNLFYDAIKNPLNDLYGGIFSGKYADYLTHRNPLEVTELGMGGCFAAGTKILMADLSLKNIEDVNVGDYIYTKTSPNSNEMIKAKVLNTVEHDVAEYLVINEELEVTREHVVFVNNDWKLAGDIEIGDMMQGLDGAEISIDSIREVKRPVKVYNFEVEEFHTYFADGYYVHNDKGGDARSDFKDNALFQSITTNGSGDGEVTFELPDNITTWRVTAVAIDPNELKAGRGSGAVKVTLPFFADFVMNEEYSIKDKPRVGLRAYGSEINADTDVEFKIDDETINGKAYSQAEYTLPDLTLGEHDVQLDVKAGNLKDSLIETYEVKGSRLKEYKIDFIPLVDEDTEIPTPDEGYSEVWFMDAGVGSYYHKLMGLYYTNGERLDQVVGQLGAVDLMKEYFDIDVTPRLDIDIAEYQDRDGVLRLIPYDSGDVRLSAITLAMDPNPKRFKESSLIKYFNEIYTNTESNFEEIVLSLLGLAALDEPVLNSLQAIKDEPTLTIPEKLYIGLAFAELGSKADAKTIYNEVKDDLTEHPYNASLGVVLAAAVGEREDAMLLRDYVYKNPNKDDVINLYELGYIKHSIKLANPAQVKFKARIGNTEKDVELNKCEAFSTLVSKMKGMSLSDIEGDLSAVVYYDQSIEPSQFKTDERINITRTYTVNGQETTNFKEGDIVRVRLTMNASGLEKKYFKIVDVLPSGLKVMSGSSMPYNIYNQEVHYGWSTESYNNYIQYYATVVNSGTFYADPARIYSYNDPSIANITEPEFITIKSLTQ
ncbi:Ig-like domain-containing protein [Patescibacteria group bacterium]